MKMVNAIDVAATGPFIKTNNIFGIVIGYGEEIAKLTLASSFLKQLIGGLYIENGVPATGYKINLSSSWLLTGEHLEAVVKKMKVNSIFNQFVYVVLQIKTQVAIA